MVWWSTKTVSLLLFKPGITNGSILLPKSWNYISKVYLKVPCIGWQTWTYIFPWHLTTEITNHHREVNWAKKFYHIHHIYLTFFQPITTFLEPILESITVIWNSKKQNFLQLRSSNWKNWININNAEFYKYSMYHLIFEETYQLGKAVNANSAYFGWVWHFFSKIFNIFI